MPHQRRRFAQPIRAEQSPRVQLAKFRRRTPAVRQRLQHKNRRPNLLFVNQAFGVAKSDGLVSGIFRIGALVPLIRLSAGSFRLLRQFQERRRCLLAVPGRGAELAQPRQVSLAAIECHHLLQHLQRFRLAPLSRKVVQRGFVRLHRQFAIGTFQQFREPDSLLATGIGKPRQLFVGKTGPHGVARRQLPFE